jgi:ATP-binding cassette subfamily B protein
MRGIKDIKVLNANESMLNKVVSKAEVNIKERVNILKINAIYGFARRNLSSMFDLGFILLGCHLYNLTLLSIPTFVIVYNYQGKIQNLLTGLATILETNKKFIINANRIYEITDGNRFKKESFGDKSIKQLKGNIEFKDVTFSYDDNKNILNNMNFIINENEKVAFVGKSGAGKTTIFNLINKLYSCNEGEILLDNININNLSRDTIRNNISVITQNPYIFNFSIKENLLISNDRASMKDIREACKLAYIDEYIMSLPDKYDTMLGENGVILSGGQKQRIAIARALIKKSSIILFDEATSALDNETQKEIKIAIDNLKGQHTILIVAHRLSTIIDADRIFVIDNGKVVNVGRHKQLLKESQVYKSLYEKELDNEDQNESQ